MKAPKSNPSQTVLVICTGFIFVYLVFRQDWILYGTFAIGLVSILFKDLAKKNRVGMVQNLPYFESYCTKYSLRDYILSIPNSNSLYSLPIQQRG